MNTDLKALIGGVLGDLIDARFQADVAAAELAEHYRDHPHMRSFSIPTLNISSVDVDLRFVFSGQQAEEAGPGGPGGETGADETAEAEKARKVAESISEEVLRQPSVRKSLKEDAQRRELVDLLVERLSGTSAATRDEPAPARRQTLHDELMKTLSSAKVEGLSDAEATRVHASIDRADARFSAAARAGKPASPRVLASSEALTSVNPETVSRISFTVDLSARRWVSGEDEDDEDVLAEE